MIDRRRAMAWFVLLGLPIMIGIGQLLSRSEQHGRGLLIIDVPADVTVSIDGRPLRPCTDEFHAHAGCSDTPTPGFARRYSWSLIRGQPAEVIAKRGTEQATTTVTAPNEGPTPHLRIDEEPLRWRTVGGTRVDGDVTTFVDDAGRVIGTVGHSEPD